MHFRIMLIELIIKNFGPFKDKTSFSMEATSLDGNEGYLIHSPVLNDPLLSAAVIFGPNASGKSYLLKAMEVLQIMVRTPMIPNISYPWYQPFRASKKTITSPVELELIYTVDNTKFDYFISFDKNHIVSESLYYYPKGRKALVFSRNEEIFAFGRTVTGLNSCSRMTSPSSSFLSVAAQYNNKICMVAHKGIINDILVIGSNMSNMLNLAIDEINKDPDFKKLLLKAMRIADIGISNVAGNVKIRKAEELINQIPHQVIGLMIATGNTEIAETMLFMEHDFEASDVDKSMLQFPYEIESNGTLQLFSLMVPIIYALKNGSTIFIDEFGTFLHSDISKWIIKQFRIAANKNMAQLVVNTHDQSLLSLELLRRDQVWFTQKDIYTGVSELYSLSDFNGVRADIDLQKTYSTDKFGAKPFIPDEDVMV